MRFQPGIARAEYALPNTRRSHENSAASQAATFGMSPKPNPLTRGKKQKVQALLQLHRLEEARPLLEQICNADRADAESWYLHAAVNQHLGNLDAAVASYRQVLALQPQHADALYYLGNALRDRGHPADAAQCYRQVIAVKPDHLEAHCNLGSVLEQEKDYASAAECYRTALRLDPMRAELHYNLGNALQELGQLDEAAQCYRRAIELRPDYAEAYNNLGNVLSKDMEKSEIFVEACSYYRRAIELKPDYFEAHYNLGTTLKEQGFLEEAINSCERALQIQPENVEAHSLLAGTLADQGRLDEAIASYRRTLEIDRDQTLARSNWFFSMNYSPKHDAAAIYDEHRRWGELYAHTATPASYSNTPDPDRRLRVGYVSPDFRNHSVAYFIESVLLHHDPARFDVTCYANVKRPDTTTARLQKQASQWREIYGRSDKEVEEAIHEDGIDILVDLAGHTAGNRLPVFAHKPAPIQATYLGYPNTTGLSVMDYRITDAWADPPGQEAFYTETLARLPRGFLCYTPRSVAPAITLPPVLQTGHVTFGSFNALLKITPEGIGLWSELLRAQPGSRLVLKNRSLRDSATRQRYLSLFEKYGIDSSRLELLEIVRTAIDHLALYNRIDIALDTFPYNGTTTTCEALWMGVPVVTLAGDRHAGRVGISLLHQVGLTELIAKTPEEYVQIAVNLAKNIDKLANLRAGLRPRMAASPLCDGESFTRSLEQAYREMWRKWCNTQTHA